MALFGYHYRKSCLRKWTLFRSRSGVGPIVSDLFEWGEVDEALAQTNLSKLNIVTIQVLLWPGRDGHVHYSHLICHARSILVVHKVTEKTFSIDYCPQTITRKFSDACCV